MKSCSRTISANACVLTSKYKKVSAGNSSSFKLLDTNDDDDENYDYNYGFSDSYADGSYAYGSYMTDVLTLGGVPVSNLTMGIANDTSNFHGVLGIGFNDSTYDNLPDSLWKQELINSTAYSLWVDDEQASTGNLLFGAIDTAKFEGNLTRIASSAYNQMEVYVYGINSSASDGSSSKITFTDDTSTDYSDVYSYPFSASYSPPDSVSNFPTELASHIWDLAGAYYHEDISMAVILCSAQIDTSATLTIQLGPSSYYADVAAVTASLVDLIIPAQDYNLSSQYSYYLSSDDEDLCLFGVQNGSTHGTVDYSLGSTLLRRTYSVFDLANMEIAIAPINFEATTTTSSIVSFASYGATAPYASLYCSSYRCSDSSTSDSTNENGGGSDPLSGVLSLGGVLGLTLGLGLGFLALGLAGFLFWRQRWRRNNAVAPKATVSAGPISSGGEAGNAAPNMSMSGAAAGVSAGPEMTESSRGAPTASNQGNPTGEQSQHEGPTNTEADLGAHDVQAGPSSRP